MTTWFVTGASRGIGAEIARAALAGSNNVVVAVRNPERLPDDLKNSDKVFAVALDVTDQESIPQAVEAAVDRFGGIDVLVNNAGRGLLGALEEITDAEARSLFDLNVFGLINVTRAVLPVMRKQSSGRLVHIGSRSGFEGEPGVSLYSASKFAVAGISEALSVELAPFGIQSMVVEPGVFRTDFLDSSSLSVAQNRISAYDGTPAHVTLDWIDRANHAQLGDPVKGAALIVEVASAETLPTHLYLGRDTLERLDVKYRQVQADLAPWREKSAATGHDDAV
ncbi:MULTISPECIES: SDR family oxidoreductase [Streptomyces]|uniref:SDR family NAD(P)-dependent oxidoreductase n=1 Tax=Streptomyces tsukubensis (strain DSM 42081 / NBRC 108919 / NRRL 18488 / 9993) TaxID=1114943 RepID=I2NAP8_STRT9|nr:MULTISPECIES: SDR family oxidoreductase [Streptomyces]AZK97881.1 short-chain dehydrogenase/reductase [Streptomyces tsukubensis]EIF94095.1 short-chain dehydrogenase/reductase SDR [Streptomyces tsukubensis NRRL18488]MYS67249.1 SDR family NAD(P)-dependent oxidoreductase [Streptomyces sp. SID5473]QKM66190.1 SDR family NAD(P)-dependent oxidoreductase [Streptomyces tsukubensis NRRL18488]TAI45472.1 SDR family oxidoreductase [Streptomyces tsukubensis]